MIATEIYKLNQTNTEIITNDVSYINLNMDQISKDNFDDSIETKVLELNKNEEKSKKGLCFPLCFIPEILTCLTCIGVSGCGLLTLIGGLLASLAAVIVPILG
jgi:hypothetical protein